MQGHARGEFVVFLLTIEGLEIFWILVAMLLSLGLKSCAVYVPFMQRAFHTVPLGWSDWGVMFLVALPIFLITEAVKWVRFGREPAQDGG